MTGSASRSVRLEAVAYLVIILLAAGLRLANLGWPPISDVEARHALAATALAGNPSPFDPGAQSPPPGASYKVATALLFQLFGSSDATARVLPALAGVALCMLPLLARRRLGSGVALALAAALSLSPTLVSVSRQAGSTSLACLGLGGVLVGLIGQGGPRRSIWTLAFLALAVASGSAWIQGLVGLLFAGGLWALWRGRETAPEAQTARFSFARRDILTGLVLLIAISTGVGLYPVGAADPFESLGAWLVGWAGSASTSVLAEILILPVYEPFLVAFGLVGTVLAFRRRDKPGLAAAMWALGGLVLAGAYPSRSGLDLAWVVLPGAYLAACAVALVIEFVLGAGGWLRMIGMTGAYLALAAFTYLQAAAYASDLAVDLPIIEPTLRLIIVFVGVLIWAVLIVLFGTGWSWATSGSALAIALAGIFTAVSVASSVRLNFGRTAAEGGELWRSQAAATGLREMRATLAFLSRANLEDPGGLAIAFEQPAPPSLAWALRDFEKAPVSLTDQAPPVVLAPSEAEPALRADYLGQVLAIAETNDWDGAFPPDVVSWWLLRRSPIRLDDWVLLVRADVATQGGLTALGNETNP